MKTRLTFRPQSEVAHCVTFALLTLALVFETTGPSAQLKAQFVPPNLPIGSQYQLIFVTNDLIEATSGNIADYNAFVTAEAALNPALPQGVVWHAVASTSSVNAATNAPSIGLPVYNTHGDLVASAGLYIPNLLSDIIYTQYGVPVLAEDPWTGTDYTGTDISNPLGSSLPWYGDAYTTDPIWAHDFGHPADYSLPLFALSDPISATPEPSTLVLLGLGILGTGAVRLRRRRRTIRASLLVAVLGCTFTALSNTPLRAQVVPPNLPAGSQYQLIFVTKFPTNTFENVAQIDQDVTVQAAQIPGIPTSVTWHAVEYTGVNAPSLGLPVYNTAGIEVAANDLYNGDLLSPIAYDQFGAIWTTQNPVNGPFVWTSFNTNGEKEIGRPATISSIWLKQGLDGFDAPVRSIYGLSSAITVTPEPSALSLLGLGIAGLSGIRFVRWRRAIRPRGPEPRT